MLLRELLLLVGLVAITAGTIFFFVEDNRLLDEGDRHRTWGVRYLGPALSFSAWLALWKIGYRAVRGPAISPGFLVEQSAEPSAPSSALGLLSEPEQKFRADILLVVFGAVAGNFAGLTMLGWVGFPRWCQALVGLAGAILLLFAAAVPVAIIIRQGKASAAFAFWIGICLLSLAVLNVVTFAAASGGWSV